MPAADFLLTTPALGEEGVTQVIASRSLTCDDGSRHLFMSRTLSGCAADRLRTGIRRSPTRAPLRLRLLDLLWS